jgi:hypothetical protein
MNLPLLLRVHLEQNLDLPFRLLLPSSLMQWRLGTGLCGCCGVISNEPLVALKHSTQAAMAEIVLLTTIGCLFLKLSVQFQFRSSCGQ